MTTDILWFSPTDFVTGDESLKVSYPSVTHPAIELTTTTPGDLKWLYLALKVLPYHEIHAIRVYYQLSDSGSFISQVRLLEMQTPDQAQVGHDDETGLFSTAPTFYRSEVGAYRPQGAVILALRLNFGDAAAKITLGAIGVEVNQVLTWNPLFGRPELRGPLSFSPGKPLRTDTGFVHYGGQLLDWDFHTNPHTPGAWDATRSSTAAWRILSNLCYPPYSGSPNNYNMRFLPYNPYGIYAVQLAIFRTMNQVPSLGSTYPYAGYMYPDPTLIPEAHFVHWGGGNDLAHRVEFGAGNALWLMKFDTEAFFNDYLVPLIDKIYQDYPQATGAPAIFVDVCPGARVSLTHVDDGWDYFQTDEQWYAGWQQVFRRIKSKYPNLKIYANWTSDPFPPDGGADSVLELVDHILFENFYNLQQLRFNLGFAYRAQKLGKGVTFGRVITQAQEPTLDDYNRAYFCAFLLTWGENSHWNGQWHLPQLENEPTVDSAGKIHDLAVFRKWFGVPSAGENGTGMWEMRPDLWTRNFLNAKVFLNLSENNSYTIPLSEAVDENGNSVSSITLEPFQGQFVFRQSPQVNGIFYSYSWRQLPNFWPGPQAYPYSISCDAIVSSLNLGLGEGNENWVSFSEDLTVGAWVKSGNTTVTKPAGAVWNGIQMNEVENRVEGPVLRHLIEYGSPLAGQYVRLRCYAQQMDSLIQGIAFIVDGVQMTFYPLKWGAYPQLIELVIRIPDDFGGNACPIIIRGIPTDTKGKFRVGAVRVSISSAPDPTAPGEYIRTTGSPLKRGSGAGIGLPLSLVGLSGYLPPVGRPQLSLLNSTQIVGLASGGGPTAERPSLGVNDVGCQYFDTTLGLPLWWSGTQWIRADGMPVS